MKDHSAKRLAEEYKLPLDVVEQIEHTTNRLKISLLRAASHQPGLPQAHQAFDELLAIATRRPAHDPPLELSLVGLGVQMKTANYYDRHHNVLTVGDLVDAGPIRVVDARQMSNGEMQRALLTVIAGLAARVN